MIYGYQGMIGEGKTILAVKDAARLARRRHAILASNIRLTVPGVEFVQLAVGDNGLEGVGELFEKSLSERRGVVLLIDEVGIILPSRFWQSVSSIDMMWACSQSRKMAADLIYTAQHADQVDVFLRRLTEHVFKVRCFPGPSIERRERGKRPWWIVCGKWRVRDVDAVKNERRLAWAVHRYPRKVEGWYNTDELVRPPASLVRRLSSRRRQPAITEGDVAPRGVPSRAPERSVGVPGGISTLDGVREGDGVARLL